MNLVWSDLEQRRWWECAHPCLQRLLPHRGGLSQQPHIGGLGVHPSGRFWESRHTSLYRDSLNLRGSGMIVLCVPGKTVVIDGDHGGVCSLEDVLGRNTLDRRRISYDVAAMAPRVSASRRGGGRAWGGYRAGLRGPGHPTAGERTRRHNCGGRRG